MFKPIGTGWGCADQRLWKPGLCSALILIEVIYQVEMDKLSKLQGLFGQSWKLKFVIKEYDGKIFEVTCEKILTEKSFWISILKKMW